VRSNRDPPAFPPPGLEEFDLFVARFGRAPAPVAGSEDLKGIAVDFIEAVEGKVYSA
jgi:hypothetical protein